MDLIYFLVLLVVGVIAILRSSAALSKAQDSMDALKAVAKFSGFLLYKSSWTDSWVLETVDYEQNATPIRAHNRLQNQFIKLVESLGMQFVDEQVDEVRKNGQLIKRKVTPAKFVKAKRR